MKKIHALSIFTALSLLPFSSSFAEWKELGSNAVMVVYVDLDTVSASGEKAQIMSMLDFKKPGVKQNSPLVQSLASMNTTALQLATVQSNIKSSLEIKVAAR